MPYVRKDDVAYPGWSPPKGGSHLQGFWGNTPAGAVIWKLYMPPLKYKELPANIKFDPKHWEGRILPDGTKFIGRKPDGTPVFGTPGDFNEKLDTKMPEKLRNQGTEVPTEPNEMEHRVDTQVVGDAYRDAMKPGTYVGWLVIPPPGFGRAGFN